METLRITNTEIISFTLVFFRTGAILFTAPFFGSKNITVKIRILLSCAVSIVLIMSLKDTINDKNNILALQKLTLQNGTIGIFIAVLKEVILGIAIGFAARLTFIGLQLAGQLVSHGMGFGMMRIMDPSTRANVTIIAQYNTVVAMLIFLLIHGHHHILIGIAKSFSAIPLAEWKPSASFVGHLNTVFASIFTTALRIAIPIMGAVFLAKVAMAIIGRTMPQMNVFVVGLPVQIAVGLTTMAISLPFFVKILHSMFLSMRENIFTLLKFN